MNIETKILDFINAAHLAEELQKENTILWEKNKGLRREKDFLQQEISRLKEELEKFRTGMNHQAGPFFREKGGGKTPETGLKKKGKGMRGGKSSPP
jgi:hypothetical protein